MGQEQSEARASLDEAFKKAKTEVPESRDTTSRQMRMRRLLGLEGSLAALGPDDVAERRVLEDALAKVRARAIVFPVGHRFQKDLR